MPFRHELKGREAKLEGERLKQVWQHKQVESLEETLYRGPLTKPVKTGQPRKLPTEDLIDPPGKGHSFKSVLGQTLSYLSCFPPRNVFFFFFKF